LFELVFFVFYHFISFCFLFFVLEREVEQKLHLILGKNLLEFLQLKKIKCIFALNIVVCLFLVCWLLLFMFELFFAVFSFAFFCYVLCKTAGIRILSVFFHFSLFLCVNIKICQLLACLLSNIRINKVILEINMYMYIYALQ